MPVFISKKLTNATVNVSLSQSIQGLSPRVDDVLTLFSWASKLKLLPMTATFKQILIDIKFITGNLLPDPTSIIISGPNGDLANTNSNKGVFKTVEWRRQLGCCCKTQIFSMCRKNEGFLCLCCYPGFMLQCCKLSRLSVFGS